MKLFACQACGQRLYFEDRRCPHCRRTLGYLPDLGALSALEPRSGGGWRTLAAPQKAYKFCDNARHGVCNWMLPADDAGRYCAACRHNHVVPDLSVPGNDRLWARMEDAEHRLIYSLILLSLPLANRTDDPAHGLAFDFLAEPSAPHAAQVMIGHNNGLITLALKEADDAVREQVREAMGEPYRTLLGHFRHESGHYFWDRLVASDAARLAGFRDLFGDERADYAKALQAHYAQGAPPDWQENFISAYATAHPFEDFAECWAHYLHIADTLETARAFDMTVATSTRIDFDPYRAASMAQLIDAWLPVTFTVNSLNRSMGQPDLYPFVLTPGAITKLGFIHALMHPAG